jgi:hypothetical protein
MGVQWDNISISYRLHESLGLKRKVLYNILTDFGIAMKIVWQIKKSFNKTYCSGISFTTVEAGKL